jgi:endogenous inhibitor of DNA gyrase (YacG/DUF329 family)
MQVHCPKCRKLVEYEGNEFRPFCSKRCKTNDLGDWASEKYAVPVDKSENENSDETDSEEDDSEGSPKR